MEKICGGSIRSCRCNFSCSCSPQRSFRFSGCTNPAVDCDRRCLYRQCSFDPTREIWPNVKIWAHRPERWEYDRVDGRQLVLLSNSATVSFAYAYDPWGGANSHRGWWWQRGSPKPVRIPWQRSRAEPVRIPCRDQRPRLRTGEIRATLVQPHHRNLDPTRHPRQPPRPRQRQPVRLRRRRPHQRAGSKGLSKSGCIALGAIAAGAGLVVVGALLVGAASAPTLVGPVAGSGTALVAGAIGAIVGARAFVECTFFNN